MLISKKSIHNVNPPFLLCSAKGKWTLVSKITETEKGLKLEVVENKNRKFCMRFIYLNEQPFYVGADIWELEYGFVLMTLNHTSLDDHPAQTLWEQWIVSLENV